MKTYGGCTALVAGALCDRQAAVKADLLCRAHYQQKKSGRLPFTSPRVTDPLRGCGFPGCSRKYYSNGYCNPHRQQLRRVDPTQNPIRQRPRGFSPRATCTRCGTKMEPSDHRDRTAATDSKPYSRCRKCRNELRILSRYSLTAAQVDATLRDQSQSCAICLSGFPDGPRPYHIDHDHSCCPGGTSCGKCVRGFLCAACNAGIGMLQDSVPIMERAIHYLTQGEK